MAKILVTAWFYPGGLMPITSIAEELRTRGHEVAFYAASRVCPEVESRGFHFHPLNPDLDAHIETIFSSKDGAGRQWDGSNILGMLEDFFVDTLEGQIDDLRRIYDEEGYDAILCEPAMWGPRVVLHELLKVPVGLLELPATTFPGPDVGIPGLDLPRMPGPFRSVSYAAVRFAFNRKVRALRAKVSALRRRYGLGPLPAPVIEMTASLPLVLVQSCPEFDYDRTDLPANHHYVGPCTHYDSGDEPVDWFDELPADRPKIHLSEGTMYRGEPLILRTALKAFADQDVSVIIAVGRHRQPEELGLADAPPNFIVRRWISYAKLLPRMDAVVTHGGGGSVMAVLQMGVPSVVVPLMWDQPENARRAEYTGAALRLPPKACTPQALRRAVARVRREPRYREAAGRMASILSRYGGPSQAAELFEREVLRSAPKEWVAARQEG